MSDRGTMKHLIMGTAGHIDHGKTTLIKKLTGIDCDTHKEEKTRGITIYLGFSHLDLPDGNAIGIVDVPGHSDFINTMIAGAAGIDFVLLVIAADAGIMPQTKEHLNIMTVLGIKKGIIVLTKTDLVEAEYLSLIEEDISELTENTFLADTDIIKFSSVTDSGLPEIKKAIQNIVTEVESKSSDKSFRLNIDRFFTIQGFGLVVTGTVLDGRVDKNSKLILLPGTQKVKIRKMERHGVEIDTLFAGDRGSLNITGITKDEIERGMLLTDSFIQGTKMIDARLTLFPDTPKLTLWSQCILLHGTNQYEVRIHLLDKDELLPDDSALVQIHLPKSLFARFGDKFIIRNSSADTTLGGGNIIDIHPLHHRRRTKKLLAGLDKIADGGLDELISAEVRKNLLPVSHKYIATTFNIPEAEVIKTISESSVEDIIVLNAGDLLCLSDSQRHYKMQNKVVRHLQTYHKHNPIDELGKTSDELLGLLGKERNEVSEKYMIALLNELVELNRIKKIKNTFVLYEHEVVFNDKMKRQLVFLEDYLKNSGLKVPLMSELLPAAENIGLDETMLKQMLHLLVFRGKAYRIENNYIHTTIVDSIRIKLLKKLSTIKEGLTVAEFRDLIDGNRKICLLLLARYDTEGITIRAGDYRIISEKGRKFLAENCLIK